MNDSTDWTHRFPRLTGIEPRVLNELISQSKVARIPKGTVLFRSGDPAQQYLLVLDGSVAVTRRNRDGQEILLYRVETGQSCILTTSCLMAGEHYPAESITETDTTAVIISRNSFEHALAACPVFRGFVMTAYGERVAELISLVEKLSFDKLRNRLIEYLIRHEKDGELRETHQHIARALGSAREVVSRHLKQLERAGLIELSRGRLRINSLQRLRSAVDSV